MSKASKKAGARQHYAGRWICQKDASKCDGIFKAWGVGTFTCPLAYRCLKDEHHLGQLEYLWPINGFGRIAIQGYAHHNAHKRMGTILDMAFCPEKHKYKPEEYQKIKDRRTMARKKYMPTLSELVPDYVPMNAAKLTTPPCGGDCENCPYDNEPCRYPDLTEKDARRLELNRQRAKRGYAKKKARMAEDPKYAAEVRAVRCGYARKSRAKVLFIKAGGTPAQFESLWAKAGGDLEVYKSMLSKEGAGKA